MTLLLRRLVLLQLVSTYINSYLLEFSITKDLGDKIKRREDVSLSVTNSHTMLKVSTWLACLSADSPAITLLYHVLTTNVNHWFDTDAHTITELCTRTTLTVVRYFWALMQINTDTMTR